MFHVFCLTLNPSVCARVAGRAGVPGVSAPSLVLLVGEREDETALKLNVLTRAPVLSTELIGMEVNRYRETRIVPHMNVPVRKEIVTSL